MSRILLVEDNQQNADMMIRLLESEGYTVIHVVRGLDGMTIARKQLPDMVLMDFDLPDMDGRLLVLTLKKQLKLLDHDIPILAVTARVGPNEEYISKRYGCDAYISKPFDPDFFLSTIKTHLKIKEDK